MSICSECGALRGFGNNCKTCAETRGWKRPVSRSARDVGYQEAAEVATDWIFARFGTEEADLLAEKLVEHAARNPK